MGTQLSRVVREYVLWVKELDYSIKGRVCEIVDDPKDVHYEWEVSHHYKPSANAMGAYYPSATRGRSLEEVEALMLTYLRNFSSIGVVKNERY